MPAVLAWFFFSVTGSDSLPALPATHHNAAFQETDDGHANYAQVDRAIEFASTGGRSHSLGAWHVFHALMVPLAYTYRSNVCILLHEQYHSYACLLLYGSWLYEWGLINNTPTAHGAVLAEAWPARRGLLDDVP